MFKIIAFIIWALAAYSSCTEHEKGNAVNDKAFEDNTRQRRLLFYDEEGNLVKTYANPYLHHFGGKDNNIFWNLMNPFFSFLRPSTFSGSAIAYMIPVSDAVVQQINNDPVYQNKLLFLSTRDPVVEANPLCNGRREPIPSPTICNGFLNCWDGWAFEQECPDGLLFSNNGYCDYTYNVDCSNRKLKDNNGLSNSTNTKYSRLEIAQDVFDLRGGVRCCWKCHFGSYVKSLSDTIDPRCHQDFETFRNESNCNEFFVCVNSVPVRFKCPSDLYYNQFLGICDYMHSVQCNLSIQMQSTSKPNSETTAAAASSQSTEGPALSNKPSFKPTLPSPGNVLINSVYDSQTWTSMHMAMSRQDAIRQLKLKSIADVKIADTDKPINK